MIIWIFHTATLSNYLAHTYIYAAKTVSNKMLSRGNTSNYFKLNLFWTSFPFSFKQNVKMQHNSSHQ